MPTAEEAAAANAAYRAANGLPPDATNTAILTSAQGQAYLQQQAQLAAQQDASNEAAKQQIAFSQPRDDNNVPRSAAFNAINAEYQQQRNSVVGSSPTYQQGSFQATVPTGGVATGRAGEYAAAWTPLTPSKYSQELANQPAISTVPVHDISSNAPTRQELLFGYSDYEQQAINEAPLRPGFTEAANLGDTRTQMAVQGVSILRSFGMNIASEDVMMGRILEAQRQAAFKTPGQTDDRYYSGELQKWVENKVELSSTYHHIGMKAGIPIPANRFEYQGDLAVELLKGAPRKDSERFSPVSGEMAPHLPQFEGRGEGIQDYAWRLSEYGTLGAGPVSYSPGIEKLLSSEGQYGPYGVLWGARKGGGNPSVIGARNITVSEDYVPFKGASIKGGGVVAEVGTRIDATSPQNVEVLMAGGALPKPFRSGGAGVAPSQNTVLLNPEQKGRLESVFQVYGHATDISLSFVAGVPSALTLGLLPKASFTPFADQNRRTGLGSDNPILSRSQKNIDAAVGVAQSSWSEQDTQYGNYLDTQGVSLQQKGLLLQEESETLKSIASANTKNGYWTGDQKSLDTFNSRISTLNAKETALKGEFTTYSGEIAAYNQRAETTKKLYSNVDIAKQDAFKTGAYVVRDGQLVENPDMKRAYGAASDWGIGASDFLTSKIGISREKFASYDIVVGSQAPVKVNPEYGIFGGFVAGEQQKTRNIENAIYGFNKEIFTNPEGLTASAISGLQISMLTSGVGGVVSGVVTRGGVGSGVASVIQRVGSNPVVTYGVPSMFIVGGVVEATDNFTLPASKSSMNIGQSGAHLTAMVMGGAAPAGVEILGTANPRLSYLKTEQYDLRYVDQPSPLYPSGVGSRQTLTTTTTTFSPNLNIFGRDIALVPQRFRATPEVKTEMWDMDVGGIVAARLRGSELNPTSGVRTVTLRGEYPMNPFGNAPMRVTGDVRIGEMQLPRTYQEYITMGAADARRMGISQEEATASLMMDASRVTQPTTGYRTLDVYAQRSSDLYGSVDWTVARTNEGMGVEFNVIDRESFVQSYSQTTTGGRSPTGRIDIVRDMFGVETGNLELGGRYHPESIKIAQLQELSRSGTGKGMNEHGIVFDQRGNVVSDVVGTRSSVAIDRPVADALIARGETASLAHSHPLDYFGDYVNINRIKQGGIIDPLLNYITRKDYQNAPSVGDLEIMGNSNSPGVTAEYIATPRGVIRFTPNAQYGWRLFDLVSKNPGAHGPYIADIMRYRGATAEFIGQNRQWVSPTGYTERVSGVSAEMRGVYSETSRSIINAAIDRRAMGNPNLEFLPERVNPTLSQSGSNLGVGSGGAGPSSSKRGMSQMAVPETNQKQIRPMGSRSVGVSRPTPRQITPQKQEMVRVFDSKMSTPAAITKPAILTITPIYGFGSGIATASASKQSSQNNILSIQRTQFIAQPQQVEYVRAFSVKSDVGKLQESKREYVRAFRMGSDLIKSQPQDSITTPTVRFIQTPVSGVLQDQQKMPMQKTQPLQKIQPLIDVPPIRPIERTPIPPEPIIPIGGGGWAPPFGGGRGSPQRGHGIRSAVATHSVGADLLGASRGSFTPMTMPRGKKGKKMGMPSFRMPRF